MNALNRTLNTLLISSSPERAGLIRKIMARHDLADTLQRISADDRAAERVRRMCVDRSERRPDLVLFDFVDATSRGKRLLSELALRKGRLRVPVVVLTSQDTEDLLQSGALDKGEAVMFAPGELGVFVKKLSDRRRKRYLWSLAVLYQYGPILLRSNDCDAMQEEQMLAHVS